MIAAKEVARLAKKIDGGSLSMAEPLFVLRAQDILAPKVVLIWAVLAEQEGCPAEKVAGARALAEEMKKWPIKRFPGRPETEIRIHSTQQHSERHEITGEIAADAKMNDSMF